MRNKPGKRWSSRRRGRKGYSSIPPRKRKSGYRAGGGLGRRKAVRNLRGRAGYSALHKKSSELNPNIGLESSPLEEEAQKNLARQQESMTQDAYEAGYRDGYFEGGEGIVTSLLAPNVILPGVTAQELIALGLGQLSPAAMIPLLPPREVAGALRNAMNEGRPLSVIRLGDGELLTLAHDTILPVEEVCKRGPFLPYSGVELPAHSVREALANALRRANIIGVPQSRHPSFQGLLLPVFSHYGLNLSTLPITSSTVNYAMEEEGLLIPLLQGRRVLIVGNRAEGLAMALRQHGIEISGLITPVRGVHDTELVVQAASGYTFDIALVAAGIAAVLICTEIAGRLGKSAFDFGHLANKLESGA